MFPEGISTSVRFAEATLRDRLAAVVAQKFIEPANRRSYMREFYDLLEADYIHKDRKTLPDVKRRWKLRLKKHFTCLAANVSSEMLNNYVDWCRKHGLSPATVNRDLSALRRAFTLAKRAKKILEIPYFPHLKEADARQGFITIEQYLELAKHARPLWFRALLATAYSFGLRRGELTGLRVHQFDKNHKLLDLAPDQTKTGKPRKVALTQETYALLSMLSSPKKADDFLFSPTGKRVRDVQDRWRQCAIAAGLGRLVCPECNVEVIGRKRPRCP